MGGLVGRAIDDSLYDSYVSLGTPHNGTWAALGGFWSQAARDMIPGSKFLADLKYGRIWNKYSLNISAQYDILVPNSFFNQDVEDLTIPNTTHVSLLWSKRTFYEIYSWLIYEVLNETGLTSKDEGHEAKVDVKE